MSRRDPTFVFGYGSLLRRPQAVGTPLEQETPCNLVGHRRRWDVAMDNRRTIPGYKYYVDPATGERPAVYVTFLNIYQAPQAQLNGVAFPVVEAMLPLLDLRERNYERCDVTDRVDVELGGRVWAYVGRKEARDRFKTGLQAGTAVVSRQYLNKVRTDFGVFGAGMLAEFDRTTERLSVPLRALERIAVPADVADDSGTTADDDDAAATPHWAVEGGV